MVKSNLSNLKFDYVDAMRGLAILFVIAVHTGQYGTTILPPIIVNIVGEGQRGVQLFYVASAFTLFLSFQNKSGTEINPTRNFYLRRFFRIAPMYYLGILYYVFQNSNESLPWIHESSGISVSSIMANVFFLHGLSPYWIFGVVPGGWTIAVEMMFYAILPYLFSKIQNIKHAFNFLLLSLILRFILQAIFKYFTDNVWDGLLFYFLPNQLPIFALGILMYFIIIRKENISQVNTSSLLLFSLLFLGQLFTGRHFFLTDHILFGIGFLLLGVALSRYKFLFIVNPVINYFGTISYSMYLVHFAVLHNMQSFGFIDYAHNGILNFISRFLIVLIITVIFSAVTYKAIEIPFQKLGKRIINKAENSIKVARIVPS